MKQLLILAVLVISFSASAQRYPSRTVPDKDSADYYSRQMSAIMRTAMDSARQSEAYQSLAKRYRAYASKLDNYTAFVLFTEVMAADFSSFNEKIKANGFSVIDGPVVRFGIGFTNKTRRKIFDFSFFSLGLEKESKKGDEKIRASVSNVFVLDLGYDLVRSKEVNIYPYGGVSFRTASLSYEKPVTINPTFTDITNLIQNDQSVYTSYAKLGLQAGIGFDLVLNRRNNDRFGDASGTMIFIKAGTNQIIGKEKYKTETVDYVPGIKYGTWTVTMGFKFFGR